MTSPGSSPHVLVVEPDPAVRALLSAVLRRSALHVTACGSDDGAADECRHRDRFAAVLLSADMPRFDALLDDLRVPHRGERPKIIVTTVDARNAPPIGDVDAVLWKPLDLDELQDAIAACCIPADA